MLIIWTRSWNLKVSLRAMSREGIRLVVVAEWLARPLVSLSVAGHLVALTVADHLATHGLLMQRASEQLLVSEALV